MNIMKMDKFSEFKQGVLDELPLQLGVIPFGIIYGVLGVESGMSAAQTLLLSLILFGGASQIVFAQLIAGVTPAGLIIGSVTTINLRHSLYGMSIRSWLIDLPLRWRILLGYLLTDEAYGVSVRYFRKNGKITICLEVVCYYGQFGKCQRLSGLLLGQRSPIAYS